MTYPRRWLVLSAVIALSTVASPAQPTAASSDPLADAVEQLGSTDPAAREEASRLLWNAGKWAEPALRRAAGGETGAEPEVAARARLLLEKIESGVRPDTPAQVLELIVRYKTNPDADVRVGAARKLIEFGDSTAPILLRLWARETDAKVRSRVLEAMQPQYARYARLLIADGDDATAEQLLDASAEARGGQADLDYAAYLAVRGKAKAKLADWALATASTRSKRPRRAAGWLQLADGDYAAALATAATLADDDLRDAALYAAGDWKTLAAMHAARPAAGEALNALGLSAALFHLAGDRDRTDEALEQLRRYADRKPDRAFMCAETFFVVGRPDEAIDLLRRHDPTAAITFLSAQLRFDEAFAAAEMALAAGAKNAAWIHLGMARQYGALGEIEKSQAALKVAVALAAADGPPALSPVISTAVEIEAASGLRERAIERALAAPDPMGRGAVVTRLFPPRGLDARFWWQALRGRPELRDDTPRQTFERLSSLLGRKFPAEQVRGWCDDAAERVLAEKDAYTRKQGLVALSETLRAYGLEAPAAALLERAARSAGAAPDALLRLGDLATRAGRWDDAAAYYARARALCSAEQSDAALAAYLQGWALTRAGRASEGKPLIDVARALPLGSDERRGSLCEGLEERGLKQEAADEGVLQMRLHGVWSMGAAGAARRAAVVAAQRRDYAAEADLIGRSLLAVVRQESFFSVHEAYLAAPRAAETYRALATLAISNGDSKPGSADARAAALAETLRRLLPVFPADTDWTIRCVTALDAHGRRELADSLFAENARLLRSVCDKHPRAAQYYNSLAWLAARCGRDLDGALSHAKRAVELQPSNPAFQDTLAEAHFRRGENAAAIECIRKCLEADPESPYFRGQLKRFEAGGP